MNSLLISGFLAVLATTASADDKDLSLKEAQKAIPALISVIDPFSLFPYSGPTYRDLFTTFPESGLSLDHQYREPFYQLSHDISNEEIPLQGDISYAFRSIESNPNLASIQRHQNIRYPHQVYPSASGTYPTGSFPVSFIPGGHTVGGYPIAGTHSNFYPSGGHSIYPHGGHHIGGHHISHGFPQSQHGFPHSQHGYPQSQHGFPQRPHGFPQIAHNYPQSYPNVQHGYPQIPHGQHHGHHGSHDLYPVIQHGSNHIGHGAIKPHHGHGGIHGIYPGGLYPQTPGSLIGSAVGSLIHGLITPVTGGHRGTVPHKGSHGSVSSHNHHSVGHSSQGHFGRSHLEHQTLKKASDSEDKILVTE